MKKIITTVLILTLAAGGAYYILQKNKEKNAAQVAVVAEKNTDVVVRTAKVAYENINDEFTVDGNFLANTQATIAAETGGQIVALYVKEGSSVGVGQVIAKLKGDKYDVNVNNAQANLEQAISALNRYEAAYKTGGVTALQLDQARLQVKNARAQVQSAQLSSGDTVVRSKVRGIVNKKNVELGMVIGAGTAIVEVVDISSLKLKVDVDEANINKLSLGESVKVKPSVEDGTVEGRITFIAPAASGALKFPVEVTVPNNFNKLKAGMYGTAIFGGGGHQSRELIVPRTAFVGSVSDNQIFIVKNNTAQLVEVQSGTNYGDKVQILGGLKEGDVVITSGQINLSNGSKVSILK